MLDFFFIFKIKDKCLQGPDYILRETTRAQFFPRMNSGNICSIYIQSNDFH